MCDAMDRVKNSRSMQQFMHKYAVDKQDFSDPFREVVYTLNDERNWMSNGNYSSGVVYM